MTQQNHIVIITDDPGWHGRELTRAFATRGFSASYVSLMECHLALAGSASDVVLPGVNGEQLAGVFVRGVPGGSLAQVILRLNVLHILSDRGVTVYNTGRAIERTVDKAMTSFLLKQAGLPTPDTWVCESLEHARAITMRAMRESRTLVMKPLFGSQGIGVRKVQQLTDLDLVGEDDQTLFGGVYYLQDFIGPVPGHSNELDSVSRDWRVFVINGRAEAMMLRTSEHWITNRAQGAKCQAIDFNEQLAQLAEVATASLNIDYAGVDIMQDQHGQFLVTEVNSVPAWWGLQKVIPFNLADRIADHFIAKIAATQQLSILK